MESNKDKELRLLRRWTHYGPKTWAASKAFYVLRKKYPSSYSRYLSERWRKTQQ
jgi:hypothetical protein